MTITLDLWTKKRKSYYAGLIVTLLTLSFIMIATLCNLQSKSSFEPLYDTIIAICMLISFAFFFTILIGVGYLKDGELLLADNYLVIDTINLPLSEITYINLKMSPRDKQAIVLNKNLITIGDKDGNIYKRRFAIKSYHQNQEVEKILATWRTRGLAVYAYYNGI